MQDANKTNLDQIIYFMFFFLWTGVDKQGMEQLMDLLLTYQIGVLQVKDVQLITVFTTYNDSNCMTLTSMCK